MSSSVESVAERYGRFARDEARGRSALYEEWAAGVASDRSVARLLARIPETRRQPPLVFAVSRLLGAPESGYPEWARWARSHADQLVDEVSRRTLQTNEPLRCAAMLPALSLIDGPIALLEVGASAGLCLYPDRYSYRFAGRERLDPASGASPVVLSCTVTGHPPLRMPEIVWRGGIDPEPRDPADPADRRFLTALAWPGESGRRERIAAALEIAAAEPATIVRGDASAPEALDALIARAPREATLVITTPGVLPHIPRAARERLLSRLSEAPARWISIDPPRLHTAWRPAVDPDTWGGFVLGLDGRPLAAVDPLGAWLVWRDGHEPPTG